MRRPLALILGLALLLLVLWYALGRGTSAPTPEQAAPPPVAESQAAAVERPPAEVESARVDAERASVPEAPAPKVDPKLAELRGRLVLENGAPAAGAELALQGFVANSEREMKHGKPKDWKNRGTSCDADGRFVLRFDPPRAFQFVLQASHPGSVQASWRWSEIEPGTITDLGETVLPRGGAVAGRVLNAQGKPTGEAWSVSAEVRAITKGEGSNSSNVNAQADPATGEFRIEDLPPGLVQINAYSPLASRVDGPKVEVRAGETVEADIRYTGPDNSRRIVVATSAAPFHRFGRDVAEVRLSAPGMETRKGRKQGNSNSSYSFDDLEPGAYSVEVEDPRFLPWRQDGVQPGQRVSAKLVGAGSVSLGVVDAATRSPIARWMLRVRFKEAGHSPNEFELVGRDAEPPQGGLVEGLIPVDQTLIVLAEGYAPAEVEVPDLKAGEQRALTVELRHGATLVARLLEADGKTPIAGLAVTIAPSTPHDESSGRIFIQLRDGDREELSGADGRASFTAVAPGTYTLRAEITPLFATELDGVSVTEADTRKEVELVLPPNGWLVGRVLGPEPAMLEGCYLTILPVDLPLRERALLQHRVHFDPKGPQNRIAADGSFRAGPLRAGKSKVTLQFPPVKQRDGPSPSWASPGAAIELGEVEIPAGGELQRDFDLREKLPGRVEVTVSVNGAPAANARVSVRSVGPTQHDCQIALDAQGHGLSGAVVAGGVFFDIWAADDSWSHMPQGSWTVRSDETLRVQWDVQLAAGKLQLVEEGSGAPIAGKQVSIFPEVASNGVVSGVNRTTDAEGRFEVRLVAGGYRVAPSFERGADGKVGPSPYQEARFDWTANGPTQAVLKLAKKP